MRKPFYIGFTLIELLVVIAIIVILAGILFPVFAAAREKARTTSCLNNMGQLGKGIYMYVGDWNDRFPGFGQNGYPGNGHGDFNWVCPDSDQTCWPGPAPEVPELVGHYDYKIANPKRGTLWTYNKNLGIYKCPSYAKIVNNFMLLGVGASTGPPFRWNAGRAWSTYAMNGEFAIKNYSTNAVIPIPMTKVNFPADTFLLYDENPETNNDGHYLATGIDWPGGQHNDGANVLCADMHVKRFRTDEIGNINAPGPLFCNYRPDRRYLKTSLPGDCR
jgi:prepilin-type N-terminal cleavage/methylation domain-containing protein